MYLTHKYINNKVGRLLFSSSFPLINFSFSFENRENEKLNED